MTVDYVSKFVQTGRSQLSKAGVIGFGALNLDKIYLVDKIPSPDQEGFVKDVKTFPGGSAANTVVGLSRLGIKTGYLGKVGKDEEGKILLNNLISEKVETSGVIVAEGRSGTALIFVDESGNRAILVDPGVNDTIRFKEINLDLVEKFKMLHLTSFICKISDESFNSQKKLVKEFDFVSFDPGLPYAEKGLKSLEPILKHTTIFLPSKQELEIIFSTNYEEAADLCIQMGIQIVAVKMGERGCWIKTSEDEFLIKPFNVKVIDTTGAGDAFNAGFIYGFLKNKEVEKCGRLGNYVASLCIQKIGARDGLPNKINSKYL
ncbi:sugar kinase [Archaeoglobales archaeon]|nr:MAG: sugar kinase [Archaeoglobales archaeon ex4484_92]RLI81043.1 MAG: sugar kinase [Archaeoglobales archaeon]